MVEVNVSKLISLLAMSVLCLTSAVAQAAEASGKIGYMSGALVAQRLDGTVKVMGPKSEVFAGDMLVTAKDSYAQVVMNDGTKMTLRPNSNLKIEAYQFKQDAPKADNAVFRLLKGGFRTVTGLIGKRGNADAYQLRAATATIGIRGTDFTSRLCATKDCADDNGAAMPATPVVEQPKAVGRVMLIQGEMAAKEVSGKIRKLTLGSPVFEGDTLQSSVKSYGVVVFRDGGRVTVQESSAFQVESFKYDKATNQESAALRLLKGGVRVVTGLIGRANHDNYKFRMSGATIGIRGTGFDAWSGGACGDKEVGCDGVYVWSGEVVLVADDGVSLPVAVSQAASISKDSGKPVRIITVPKSVLDNLAPKPDSVPVDLDKLFEENSGGSDPGLYVTVHDGQVILQKGDNKIDLGRGETGFSSDQLLARLATTPGFMGVDKKMDNIEKGGGNSGIGTGGCMVGQ